MKDKGLTESLSITIRTGILKKRPFFYVYGEYSGLGGLQEMQSTGARQL